LTEGASQFGTDRTWQGWGSRGAVIRQASRCKRLLGKRLRRVVRKKIEKDCNNFQGYAGGKAIGIQQYKSTEAHM
jgi:hypothetical protein